MKKVLVLSNSGMGLYKFRKELMEKLNKAYDLTVSVPEDEYINLLEEFVTKIHIIPISRRSLNPLEDFFLIKNYYKLIKKINPDFILTYTIKPNIYGGVISRILGIRYLVNITGLGTAIEKNNFLSKILFFMYSIALKKAEIIFFQNSYNQEIFNLNVSIHSNQVLLPGSGVNLEDFPFLDYPQEKSMTKFLFIGRIMKAKGIDELLTAYKLLSEKYKNVSLTVIGPIEDGYDTEFLNTMIESKKVDFLGEQKFVNEFIHSCHVLINPSHHEGMSNVLLEAGSSGRPLLASNIPGCKEIVKDGVNGYVFEPQNHISLFNSLEKFHLLDYESKLRMGRKSSSYIKERFDRKIIVNSYISVIDGGKVNE